MLITCHHHEPGHVTCFDGAPFVVVMLNVCSLTQALLGCCDVKQLMYCLQEGAGQVLSLCIRIYCHNKSSPTVVSTAAATIRQAVALLFDHAVEDAAGPDNGAPGIATAREVAAVLLLQDLMNMCAGMTSSVPVRSACTKCRSRNLASKCERLMPEDLLCCICLPRAVAVVLL